MMTVQHHHKSKKLQPAIFLDRDGTINVEKNYLYRFEDWEWISGAQAAIAKLNEAGFLVVVVSNQAGVARGLYTEQDVIRLHEQVVVDLNSSGGNIDAFYYCPHHPEHGDNRDCDCRKPRPGMLLEAAKVHNIDLSKSWIIGDRGIDIKAGQLAGVSTILVRTGYGEDESGRASGAIFVADSLCDAIERVIALESKRKLAP
jgi:D-glycero-D-manno-heptose 1,7-bisphosphate phosphatase